MKTTLTVTLILSAKEVETVTLSASTSIETMMLPRDKTLRVVHNATNSAMFKFGKLNLWLELATIHAWDIRDAIQDAGTHKDAVALAAKYLEAEIYRQSGPRIGQGITADVVVTIGETK